MSDQTVSVTIKGIGDFSDVVSSVGSVQKALTKLKLPDKLGDNLSKNITAFYKEYEKYQKKINEGIKTQGDYNQVEKYLNNIRNLYQAIGKDAQKLTQLDMADMLKLDTGEFKKIIDEMTSIMKQIGNVKVDTAPFTKALKDIQGITKNSKITGENGLLNQIIGHINTGQIAEAKNVLKELEDYAKRVAPRTIITTDKKGNKVEKQAPGTISSDKYQKLTGGIDEIRAAIAQADSALDPLIAKYNILQKELDETKQKASQSIKKNFGDYNQASGEVEKLTDSLKRMHQEEFSFNRQVQDIDRQIQSYFGLSQMIRKVGDIARDAFNTVKELDAAMVQTAVVTNFDVGDMWNMLPTYTEQANQLGATIKDVYEAATLYYQQGLNTNQAMGLANETLKMARIAGLDAADATNMMTAALRGFNMEINQTSAQKINDIYSELAAITASDTKEIGSAMERTASIANSANMDFATTSAFLAQMIETTREAPENLGTAMKTIVARFQEMKQDPTKLVDSEGVAMDANKVDAALKTIGVNLTNTRGEFRNLDEVFLDISAKWDSLTQGQQRYIATIAAGSRQQSRFIAMMSDYDRTMELVDAANNSAGASQKQFEKTLDSMSTKLNRLKNAWDQFTMGLMNNQIIKFSIDSLTNIFTVVNKIVDALGSLPPSPFEGITKSALTLVTTLGMLNFGAKASRGLVRGGVGWWTGEQSFTGGFSEGFKQSGARGFLGNKNKNEAKDANTIYQQQINKRLTSSAKEQFIKTPIVANTYLKKIDTSNLDERIKAEIEDELDQPITEDVKVKINKIIDQDANGSEELHLKDEDLIPDTEKIGQFDSKIGSLTGKLANAGELMQQFGSTLNEPVGSSLVAIGSVMTTLGTTLSAVGVSFKANLAAELANVRGTTADIVAKEGLSIANLKAAATSKALGKALWASLGPYAAIALAIAAVVGAYKLLDKAIVTNKEKIENATDAAAKASEAYDSAKQETSELADAISQIQDNDNAFDNLVAGTAEFNEKLVEANQKITELINKYPMLNDPKFLSTDENGLMHITQAGLDYVKEYQKQRQNNAAALTAMQTAQLNSEENRQKASKLRQGDIFGTETEESYKKRLQEAEYLEKSAEAAEKVAQQTAISSSLASDEIKNREKISAMYAGQYDDLVKQVDTTKMGIEEMRQAYADFYGYTYNKSTKEMTDVEGNVVLTKDDDQVVKDAIPDITVLTNFEANASSLDNMIDSIDKKFAKGMGSSLKDSGNLLTDILSDNIETNEDALRELIQDPGKIVEGIEKLDDKEIAALLNISEEQVNDHREEFAKVLENKVQKEATNIADAQSKSYEDLAAMMAQTTYGTIEHATNYAGGGWLTSQINRLTAEQAHTMSNIGTALRKNVGPEAMSAFIEDATDIYTNASQKTIDKFNTIIGKVNWESATSRLEGYNKAINSSNERIQEWGHSMRNSTEEANILGESFNEFLGGDWTELSENADDFKNAMGEIDAEGILKASEQSKTLKTLLDSGEVSANAVAKALQGVEEGKFSFGEVNGVVLQLISSLDRLSEVGAEAHRIIKNFDAGVDTGEGEDFVKDNAEKATEYYENNEWGNEQLHNYIKLAAGTEEWNKALRKNHGDLEATTKSLMKYVTTFKDGFGPAWEQLVNGKNINGKGLEKAIEDSHVDEALKKKFKDVKFFTDENGFLNVDAAELTTKELQTYFEEVYGVSEEYAALMMQNLQNYDATISSMLQKNDLKETITSGSFQAARGSGKDLILTDAEIETFKAAGGSLKELADAAGTTAKDLKKNSFKVLDEDGERRQDYVKLTQEYAKKFYGEKASLASLFGIDSLLTDGKLDLSKLVTDTQSKGFDQEQAMQAAYAAYRKSEKTGETTLYDGMELEKGLASYEEFTAAIEKVTESSQWYDVGQAIAEGIISYIENGNSKDNNTGTKQGRPSDVGTGNSQLTEEEKIKKDIEAYKQLIAEMGQSGKEAYNYYKKNGFGNTDLSNRQVLDWGKNPTKNKNFAAAATWFTDEEGNQLSDKEVSKKLKNKESTYLSSSMGFGEGENTVEIAFTPMLQTKDGKPQMLSRDAVVSYLDQIVTQATNESGKIDTSKLLELDKTGITTEDGQTISNLVMGAFKGENAIETANAFTQLEHELGEAEMEGLSLEKVLKGIKFTPKIEGAELEKYIKKIDGLTDGQKEILLNTELSGEEKATQFLESVEKEFGGSDKKKKDFIIGAAVNFSQGDEKEGLEILKKAGFSDKEAQQIKQKLDVAYDPKITNESEVQSSIKKQVEKITTNNDLKQTLQIKAKAEVTANKKTLTQKVALKSSGKIENEPGDLKKNIQYTANKKIINEPKNLERTVKYTADTSGIGSLNQTATLTLNISENSKKFSVVRSSGAKGINNRISFSPFPQFGSAAKGQYGKVGPRGKGGLTLTGEKGFEIAWLPSESRSMILGAGGPQMTNLPSDAVVYTHEQSKEILKRKSIPAGSHANPQGKSGIKIGGGTDTTSSSPQQPSKDDKKKDDDKKKEESKQTKAKAKIIDKAGKISVWWENQTRKVDSLQRRIDKTSKAFETAVGRFGSTVKNIDPQIKNYISNLKKSIKYNQQSSNKANKDLKKLAGKGGKGTEVSISWERTKIKKTKKGKKKKSKVTKKGKINLANYIRYDEDTGAYVIDQGAINKVAKKNKSKAKAIKEAAQKRLDTSTGRKNTADDNITKAREALNKLSDDIYTTFYQWENSLNKIYFLTKQLNDLSNQLSYQEGYEELLSAKALAGFYSDEDDNKLLNVLEQQKDIMLQQVDINKANLEEAQKAYAESLDYQTYVTRFQNQPDSQKAQDDLRAARWALNLINSGGTFDEKQIANLEKAGYSKESIEKIKEILDNIDEKRSNAIQAATDSQQSITAIYNKLKEYQDYIADFESELVSGIEEQTEKEINRLDKLNSSLSKAFKDLIDTVKRNIDERRKEEDNAKTESDIAKKQQRLSALRADTSGGHAVEIAQLEKEIAEAQQGYQRTLEDQLIDKLQNQGDLAEQQRQQQIDLLNAQKELAAATNSNLEQVKEWLKNPSENKEEIRQAWLANHDYDTATDDARQKLENEFEEAFMKYGAYSNAANQLLADLHTDEKLTDINKAVDNIYNEILKNKDSNTSWSVLKSLGVSAAQAKTVGATAKQLKDAKYSITDIFNAGYTKKQLTDAGITAKSLKKAGADQSKIAKVFGATEAMVAGISGKTVQKQLGTSVKAAQRIINKSSTDAATQKSLAGMSTKIDINGKKKGGKTSATVNNSGKTVTANKGSTLYSQKLDTKTGKTTGKVAKTTIDKLSTKNFSYNKKEATDALVSAIKNTKVGDKINKNMKELVAAAGIAGKQYKLKNGIYGSVAKNGKIYFNESGTVKIWDTATGKLTTDKYNKNDYLNKAKKNNNVSREYAQVLINKKAYTKEQLKKAGVEKFVTGGLANQTGLAWLDGTPSKPELVLNAKDTKNFIALKDVLSHIMTSANNLSESYGGNATYEININVDHLNNDYDVDKVAERVKKKIVQDSGYRNVTQVRKFR